MKKITPFFAFSAFLLSSSNAYAEEYSLVEDAKKLQKNLDFLTLSVENDLFGKGTDQHYTNGVRLTYHDLNATIPEFIKQTVKYIPFLSTNNTTTVHYSFGQNMYTPDDIKKSTVDIFDRPWAAFTYGSVGLTTLTDDSVDEIELTLGMVGPSALGEPIQKFVHELIDSPEPQGWDTQLADELGVNIMWQRQFPTLMNFDKYGLNFRAAPHVGAAVGNIYTHGNGGLTLHITPTYSRWQDAPARVRPSIPGSGIFLTPDNRFSWSAFASIDNRIVARNIFLDGNTFRRSHHIEKRYFVVDASAGVTLTYDDIRLSYSVNYRSKEYKGQDTPDVFGSLSLGYRF